MVACQVLVRKGSDMTDLRQFLYQMRNLAADFSQISN